jgi:hypothetical protein
VSEHVTSFIRLYKALGGGWPTAAEAPTTPDAVSETKNHD